jgi:hypothetical protein
MSIRVTLALAPAARKGIIMPIDATFMNIADEIVERANALGLDAMATGGGCDYICKDLGQNDDGSTRVAVLASAEGPESPYTLNEASCVDVYLTGIWDVGFGISFPSAEEAMKAMGQMTNVYTFNIDTEDEPED